MVGKRFIQFHFIPLAIAVAVLCILLFSPFSSFLIKYDDGDVCSKDFQNTFHSSISKRVYFEDLSASFTDEQEVMNYWLPQRPLVVFGSSEITHWELMANPYNFFSQHGIPCIGIGHAGNQSFCMLTQLALMHNFLDSMRLVIILSPGWFEGPTSNGTPLETFLEYNDEHFLYYLENDKAVSAEVKNGIDAYVSDHLKEIDAPSSILRKMAYRHIAERSSVHAALYAFQYNLLSSYCENKRNRMDEFFREGKSAKPFTNPWNGIKCLQEKTVSPVSINWDSLQSKALSDFSLICTNNAMGVENNYYDQWMKGKSLRIIKPVKSESNQEFKDLLLLLSFLRGENCKPLIVMQPLNPLCHENLADLDPLLAEIGTAVKKNGFEYLDLNTSDKSKYKIGMLSDFQHMGDYGWYLVDQKINNYFFYTANEK